MFKIMSNSCLRETWGKSSVWHKNGINFNIKLVFILGLDVIGRHYNIQKESEKFQDILQIDFIEGFGIRNLTCLNQR